MLDRKTRAAGTSKTATISDYEASKHPRSHDGPKNEIWTSMLDGVASGKRLPKRNILVLGA
jgi:dynein light intermediate chain 1